MRVLTGIAVAATLVALPAEAAAQGKTKQVAQGPSGQVANAGGMSLGALEYAQRNADFTITQRRRFFRGASQPVVVREEVKVDANGTDTPPYSVTFLGVEGELPGSPTWGQWSQNYARFASLFHEHGGFRIRDLAQAQANYTLYDFGPTTRAGRSAQRIVVLPNRLDKAIWLLEVDAASFVPLYTAEYDAQLRLLSEIEAVTFSPTVQLTSPHVPAMTVTPFANFASADLALAVPGLVQPNPVALDEYVAGKVHVTDNPLNGRRSLVLTYTDGIDEFFVVESPGVPEYFAALPGQSSTGQDSGSPVSTIARYRDPSMSVLLFWDDGVGFQVAGRGSLRRLDDFAKAIYTQAILGR